MTEAPGGTFAAIPDSSNNTGQDLLAKTSQQKSVFRIVFRYKEQAYQPSGFGRTQAGMSSLACVRKRWASVLHLAPA